MTDPPIKFGPECPTCGEPWLRPSAVAGALPLPVLHAALRARVGLPQLRRAFDDRADVDDRDRRVQPLPRQHAAGGMNAELLSERRIAPSILSADFARLGSQVAGGAGRRRPGDPRRRHGRPLRPADHVRSGRRLGDRRSGPRGRRIHRRAPDDRAARAPCGGVRARPAPTASPSTSRRRRTSTTRCTPIRDAGCTRRARRSARPLPPAALTEVAAESLDLALCMSVNPGWGNQTADPRLVRQARADARGAAVCGRARGRRRRPRRHRGIVCRRRARTCSSPARPCSGPPIPRPPTPRSRRPPGHAEAGRPVPSVANSCRVPRHASRRTAAAICVLGVAAGPARGVRWLSAGGGDSGVTPAAYVKAICSRRRTVREGRPGEEQRA